jgi:hypothetical protein
MTTIMFVCLFIAARAIFLAVCRLSPLPVTRLQILVYARRSGPLSREGSLSCHTYCDTGPRFIRSHPKTGTRHVPQWGSNPRRNLDHQIFAPDALTTAPRRRLTTIMTMVFRPIGLLNKQLDPKQY